MLESNICCYLLTEGDRGRLSYRGYTIDLVHRLRQHQGILAGGARYTKRFRQCRVLVYISGFTTKRSAQSFEWHTKRKTKLSFVPMVGIARSWVGSKHHYQLFERFCSTLFHPKFDRIRSSLVIHVSSKECIGNPGHDSGGRIVVECFSETLRWVSKRCIQKLNSES